MIVSVIIANRNDLAMLAVTVRSCIEELRPLGKGAGEVIVVDNSDKKIRDHLRGALPTGYCRDGTLKLFYQDFPCLFTARELAAEKAVGEYIICLDSHMIVGRDSIKDLVSFMDRRYNDPTLGFAHAPISWAHQHESRARHDRNISRHELGPWGTAYDHERMITWKGMPWICRRSWFLDKDKGLNGYGALSEHRVSWGGGDMHIGIKPWLLGFKNWAVPTNSCIHIGPFPRIGNNGNSNEAFLAKDLNDHEKYRRYTSSGNFPHPFGFLVSCYVLGGEPMMQRNRKALTERFGKYINIDKWWSKAIEIGTNEKNRLEVRKIMSFEQLLTSKPWDQDHSKIDQTYAQERNGLSAV